MENRGGKRAGAGRKEIKPEEKRVQLSVSVKPETRQMIQELRKVGIRIGLHIDNLVKALYDEKVIELTRECEDLEKRINDFD